MPSDVLESGVNGLSLEDLGLSSSSAAGDAEGSGSPPSGAAAPAASAAQPTPPPAQGAAPTGDPWMVPPKSWKKDYHQHYVGLPPEIQKYVHEREQQALQGVMQYKQQADAYNKVFEPYREILQQAGIQPTVLVENLARNHHVLATGTPEQKLAVARQLLQEYQIDPRALVFGPTAPAPQAQPVVPPDYDRVRQTVQQLEGQFMAQRRAEIQKEIDAFAAKNPYYGDVEADMAELISSGAAPDLQTAYDIAIYRNPEVRQKVLQTYMAQNAQQGQQSVAAKQKAAGVNMTPGAVPSSKQVGSIDDTLNSVLDRHFSH